MLTKIYPRYFDPLLLSILVVIYLGLGFIRLLELPTMVHMLVMVGLLFALVMYWLVDFLDFRHNLKNQTGDKQQDGFTQKIWVSKYVMICFAVFFVTILPSVVFIWNRASTAPHRFAHDGLIQSEIAVDMVLSGKNPYKENYENTPMALWPFDEEGFTENPALYHYPYMPFTFLLPLPFQILCQKLFGYFDQRMLYLLLFFGALAIGFHLAGSAQRKALVLIMLGLNPFFVPFLIQGRNDVIVLFGMILVFFLFWRKQLIFASIVLALCCATKQLAWLAVPFLYLAVDLGKSPKELFARLKIPLLVFGLVFLAAVMPWALWSWEDFYQDVIAFQSGLLPISYPIKGLGFSSYLLNAGVLSSNKDYFPFWIIQLFTSIPVLIYLIINQLNNNNLKIGIYSYVCWLFVFLFFSRAFNDNYMGYLISVLSVGLFMGNSTNPDTTSQYE